MILSRFIITTILLAIVFTGLILISLIKNPVWWIHDFPQNIQEEYFRTHERIPSAFFSKTVLLKKVLGRCRCPIYGARQLRTDKHIYRSFYAHIVYRFNAAQSKYKGTGAGEAQKARMKS